MADDYSRFDSRPRLGRGLAALIGESKPTSPSSDINSATTKAPIEFLYPNSRNPRKLFDESELDELATSIRNRGIIQPILVRSNPTSYGEFEIVAGERRWRAAQRAGLYEVPIIVLEINERESLEIAIIENVQRSDLNALDEAGAYDLLISEHKYTQNELSQIIGKSRSHIANMMRLLSLPERSKLLLSKGAISAGHARALLTVDDPDKVADQIIRDGLTVRDIEKLGQGRLRKKLTRDEQLVTREADAKAWKEKLSLALGANVSVIYSGEGGEIQITFRSLEQLEEFCLRLITPSGIPSFDR